MRIVISVLIASFLVACSPSYSDLEDAFPSKAATNTQPIETRTLVITSQKHRGAESYNDIVTIRLTAEAIEIENSAPSTSAVRIPTEEIAGCSMTCFGVEDQHVDLLVPKTGSDLMIPRSKAILDWCWSTRRPMVSSEARRKWQYAGEGLPKLETYSEQLSSRELYDSQAKQSCLGY